MGSGIWSLAAKMTCINFILHIENAMVLACGKMMFIEIWGGIWLCVSFDAIK